MIPVACGVLVNALGEVLIAQRPAGRIAAGKWEFPGGKIERGESARAALARELQEELGITVLEARPLISIRHDYSDRTVVLDTWCIAAWQGEPQGREQQALAWCPPERLHEYDLLAADAPIISALRLPVDCVFTPVDMQPVQVLKALPTLPVGALLRLRLPGLGAAAYEALARRTIDEGREHRLQVILDREPAQVAALGAAGWHGSAASMESLSGRPLDASYWIGGSAHDAGQLDRWRRLGADYAVLGPVCATASHPGAQTLGWTGFESQVRNSGLPVFAIGGLGPRDHARAHAHYAQGVAGISAYWGLPS